MLKVYSANEAYQYLINHIKENGKLIITGFNKSLTIEILGFSYRNYCPRDRIITEINRKFPIKCAMAEFLWYMSTSNKVNLITPYLKNWINYSDNGKTVNSNYGFQWKNQLSDIINRLKNDKHTRQAIVDLYIKEHSWLDSKDVVCTPYFQFFIRDDKLNLIVNARSRDLISGECIDQFTFTLLQELIANELEIDVGWYQLNCGSLHIYKKNFNVLDTELIFNLNAKIEYNKKTHLNYSNFWDVLKLWKDQHYQQQDFISNIVNKKQIDIIPFYNAYKENMLKT